MVVELTWVKWVDGGWKGVGRCSYTCFHGLGGLVFDNGDGSWKGAGGGAGGG